MSILVAVALVVTYILNPVVVLGTDSWQLAQESNAPVRVWLHVTATHSVGEVVATPYDGRVIVGDSYKLSITSTGWHSIQVDPYNLDSYQADKVKLVGNGVTVSQVVLDQSLDWSPPQVHVVYLAFITR